MGLHLEMKALAPNGALSTLRAKEAVEIRYTRTAILFIADELSLHMVLNPADEYKTKGVFSCSLPSEASIISGDVPPHYLQFYYPLEPTKAFSRKTS